MKQITDEMFITAARKLYEVDGEIEIDEQPEVGRTGRKDEEGAYVAAWVWVPNDAAQHRKVKIGQCRMCGNEAANCTGVDASQYDRELAESLHGPLKES